MNKKQSNASSGFFSNPVFLLIAFIFVLAGLFYLFNSPGNGGNSNTVIDYEKKDGEVVIVEYGDYQCPACVTEFSVVEQILSDYKDKVVLEYRHFPLPFHQFAMKASIASECARDQGKFTEMHNALYKANGDLGVDSLRKYAGEIGLNMEIFNSCLDSDSHTDKINRDKDQGIKDNITGTPTFYINGRLLVNSENSNYLPRSEDFKREIDLELNKK